jgi:hypothetical protein
MTRVRRNKKNWDFRSFLERWGQGDMVEITTLEQFVKESCENPEGFLEEWLRPLLEQGLSMEQAYELVMEGALRPN